MIILALDPGHKTTGVVRLYRRRFDEASKPRLSIITHIDALANDKVYYEFGHADVIVCERIVIPGRAGRETYETAEWYGRFEREAETRGIPFHGMRRPSVVNHLMVQCPRPVPKTADARVRRALQTRFDKATLSLVKGHAWAALAVAVTYIDLNAPKLARAGP